MELKVNTQIILTVFGQEFAAIVLAVTANKRVGAIYTIKVNEQSMFKAGFKKLEKDYKIRVLEAKTKEITMQAENKTVVEDKKEAGSLKINMLDLKKLVKMMKDSGKYTVDTFISPDKSLASITFDVKKLHTDDKFYTGNISAQRINAATLFDRYASDFGINY